jgi:hypothetical protein
MRRWAQIVLHLVPIGVGAYVAAATGSPIPLVISSGVNAAIGAIAQSYNPDGTPASVAYVPNGKT